MTTKYVPTGGERRGCGARKSHYASRTIAYGFYSAVCVLHVTESLLAGILPDFTSIFSFTFHNGFSKILHVIEESLGKS